MRAMKVTSQTVRFTCVHKHELEHKHVKICSTAMHGQDVGQKAILQSSLGYLNQFLRVLVGVCGLWRVLVSNIFDVEDGLAESERLMRARF